MPDLYSIIGAILIGLSLGLLGSGGSILTVPILLHLGHSDKQAIAEALAIVGAICFFGAIRNAFGRTLDWRAAVLFALPGMGGSFLGAYLAHFIPGALQIVILGIIMLLAAAMMAFFRVKESHASHKAHPVPMLLAGLGVGLVTGLVGVGGGFLIVPALVFFGGLPLKRAIGTSLAVIAFNSAVGFLKYDSVLEEHQEHVDWYTIGLFASVGVVGTLIGTAIGARVNQRILKKIFAVFLVFMAIYLITQRLPRLDIHLPWQRQLVPAQPSEK
ncbi:MAG: sulfite exporter TauE/SafE family protein [Pyrinomonadaceae bacterium]|nr:sulfite exporter TauE/SafE family protein [Phycisphaerales bacterium]